METAPQTPPGAQAQIDTIIYLATLVSRPREVDHALDRLRQLTATKGSAAHFTPADQVELAHIQQVLETYLTEKESLRGFTAESLQQKIAKHNAANSPAAQVRPILAFIWSIAIGAAGLSYYLSSNTVTGERLSASIPLFYMCIFAGASWLCFSALKAFKKELRTPYLIFALGVGALGLAFVYTAALGWIGKSDAHWEHLELTLLPFLVSYAAIYIGMRSFARALSIASWAMSVRIIAIACVIVGIAAAVAPHAKVYATEFYFDLSVLFLALTGVFSITGSIVMYRLQKKVNALYAKPIRWLLASYITMSIALWAFMFVRFTQPQLPEGALFGLLLSLPTAVGGLLMLKAATEFNKASTY